MYASIHGNPNLDFFLNLYQQKPANTAKLPPNRCVTMASCLTSFQVPGQK